MMKPATRRGLLEMAVWDLRLVIQSRHQEESQQPHNIHNTTDASSRGCCIGSGMSFYKLPSWRRSNTVQQHHGS